MSLLMFLLFAFHYFPLVMLYLLENLRLCEILT